MKKKSILEKELFASEIRYRRLFEAAKDGILILDAETGIIVDVNPFLIDLLGYSKNEYIEKSIWEIGAFQDIYENKEKFLELQQSEYVRYEDLPLETSDGSKIHVEFVSNVYLVNDTKVIQCQIRDITTRKETEADLEKTGKELAEIKKTADEFNKFTENIIDTVREPLLAIDKDLRVIKASRSFYKFFKVTAEETIGKLIYELGNHQWDIPKLKELLEKIIPEKITFDNFEVEHNFSTIGKRVMLLNARQVKRAFGKEQIILLAIEDITERKGKEDSLKETHRETSSFLDNLLNHLHAPIIIWDTSMRIKRFSHKFELLSGYDLADVIDKKIDFLFPKEKIAATLELLKNHLDDEQEVVEIDILTKDNHIKTVLWNSSRILDEEGKNIIATISQDITTRRQSELALRKSESHLRALVNTIPDLIWLKDTNGVYLSCNPMFERFFGSKVTDIIGKTDYDFVDRELADFFRENDRKAIEAGKPTSNEEWVTFADDGHRVFLDTIKAPIYDSDGTLFGILGIGRDITERMLAGQKLQASEKRFRAIFDQAPIAIALLDFQGRPILSNLRFSEMLGFSKEELSKMSFSEFTHPEDIDKGLNQFNNLLTGKISGYSMEKRYIHKNGNLIWANLLITALIDNNGVPQEIIGMVEDITEHKRAIIDLIEAKEKAEESDRLKSAFLANMSHEIRTPMNGILGFTELLLEPDLSSEQKEAYINIVNQSGQRMLNTINDIVEISKIEAGIVTVDFREVDVQVRLNELIRFFTPEATKKELKLTLENEVLKTVAVISTDQYKLDSILTNLIKNAIKYTPAGEIRVGCMVRENKLEFYVKDTGIGIPEERQQAVFERFMQADIADKDARQGSGLGLAITKEYVEMLGGKIWAESHEGKGSTFYFTLPLNRQAQEKTKEKETRNKDQINDLNIIIAEDDENSALFLQAIFKKKSNKILLSKNGHETIEICRNNPGVNLILMDIQMPGMNGYDATREIRKFNKKVIIIAQTAFALSVDRKKAIEAGCNDYIAKPINKRTLFEKIQKYYY